jgi:uncharacterized membrane protein HdeD (DUF308 family)
VPESKRRKPKQTSATRPTNPASAARQENPSPTWYVATMAGLMIAGVLMVLVRFMFSLDQLFLVGGLALIAGGFLMTTNYR